MPFFRTPHPLTLWGLCLALGLGGTGGLPHLKATLAEQGRWTKRTPTHDQAPPLRRFMPVVTLLHPPDLDLVGCLACCGPAPLPSALLKALLPPSILPLAQRKEIHALLASQALFHSDYGYYLNLASWVSSLTRLSSVKQARLRHRVARALSHCFIYDYDQKESWPTAQALWPHVDHLWHQAQEDNTLQELLQPCLLRLCDYLIHVCAAYDQAIAYQEPLLAWTQKRLGAKAPALLMIYKSLGQSYQHAGDLDKALTYTLKALKMATPSGQNSGPISLLDLAALYTDLATLRHQQGHYTQATQTFTQASFYYALALEPTSTLIHPSVASFHNYLAALYLSLARYEDALQACNKAIESLSLLGPNHFGLATFYYNKGVVHGLLSHHAQAEAAFQQGLSLAISHLTAQEPECTSPPPRVAQHPLLVLLYDALGCLHLRIEAYPYPRAAAFYTQAYAMAYTLWGPSHPITQDGLQKVTSCTLVQVC